MKHARSLTAKRMGARPSAITRSITAGSGKLARPSPQAIQTPSAEPSMPWSMMEGDGRTCDHHRPASSAGSISSPHRSTPESVAAEKRGALTVTVGNLDSKRPLRL
eukprot:COSAG01_NODE_13_length_41723_cov_145.394556_27_plen_106_part_00